MALALRKSGPLVQPSRLPLLQGSEPPRALRTLAKIIDGNLCHRCGSCVGICPTSVLSLDSEEYPQVTNLSACTDCDLCVKVCPGDEYDVASIAKQMFGFLPDVRDMHGHFTDAYLTYANDQNIRMRSTSGGLITGLLVSMLERGEIDGAVVIASHDTERWKGVPKIARTRDELIAATKSKYAIAPTNAVFQEIREVPGRYALVGLPCQIHGFHKAARLDRRIRERVVVTIGLFCHAAVEHEPMREIWAGIEEPKANITQFISRIGKHPGTPHVVLKDGSLQPVYFPKAKKYRPSSLEILNILYRLYTPPRCLTCYDSTAEFADIAVGDPWMSPPDDTINFTDGYSFALARTKRGETALRNAEQVKAITLIRLTPAHARSSNTMMGREKRLRAFRVIETARRLGRPIPNYGFTSPQPTGWHSVLTEMNMFSHFFCFVSWGRRTILRLALSPLGYSLLWLNFQKRTLRNWLRDAKFAAKRRATGKSGVIP